MADNDYQAKGDAFLKAVTEAHKALIKEGVQTYGLNLPDVIHVIALDVEGLLMGFEQALETVRGGNHGITITGTNTLN